MRKLLFFLFLLPALSYGALHFDGTSSNVLGVSKPGFSGNGGSFCLWANLTSTSTLEAITETQADFNGIGFFIRRNSALYNVSVNSTVGVDLNGVLTPNVWHFFCVSCQNAGTGWTLYVDGVSTGTSNSNNLSTNNVTARWGQARPVEGGQEFFSGDMADARWWNRELSASDVQQLYLGDFNSVRNGETVQYPFLSIPVVSSTVYQNIAPPDSHGFGGVAVGSNMTQDNTSPPHLYVSGGVY